MTTEEAIKELRDASDSEVRYGDTEHHYNEVMKRIEAFDMAIKALEQQSCKDCTVIKKLSRKYYVEDAYGYTDENIVSKLNEIIDVVNKLSSVTPTRPIARWEGFMDSYKECSRCGKQIKYYYDYKYCPGCGSEMVESEDKDADN